MKRVLFLTNYPSPYRVCFFDTLGKSMDVTVLFSERAEEKKHRDAKWFVGSDGSCQLVQLQRRAARFGSKDLCLDVVGWLKKPFDHIVICGYSSPTMMLAMFYLRLHKIPFYIEVDGGLIRQDSRPKYLFKKALVSSADWWLSTGAHTTDYLVHYGAKRERVFTYPFTSLWEKDILAATVSSEEKADLRRALEITENRLVLSVGRFDQGKGFDVLLKAAAQLPADTGLYIIGGEPTEDYLQLRQELGLTNVHFCGFKKKEELALYYRAADLFALATRSDVWGLVVNEAMAAGLPVVTTDKCVAGLELVEDGVNGYIVPVDDVEALGRQMNAVLEGDLARMGAAALETARKYTIENMAKAHVEIFDGRR